MMLMRVSFLYVGSPFTMSFMISAIIVNFLMRKVIFKLNIMSCIDNKKHLYI